MAITSPVDFICVPSRRSASREFVERPARDLDDAVVERRLERRAGLARHRVGNLVEPPPGGDLRRDPRDRIAGRLGGERRRARHPRVHLDDVVLVAVGCERELDVATALDVERVDDAKRRAAQLLVLPIGERLRRRDDHRIAGVHAHGIEVLHVADGDARPRRVADDLVLDLAPAGDRALDEHLADRRRRKAREHGLRVALLGFAETATGAAERERGTHHQRQAPCARATLAPPRATPPSPTRRRLADLREQLLEPLAVFRGPDRAQPRARARARRGARARPHRPARPPGSSPSARRASPAAHPAAPR